MRILFALIFLYSCGSFLEGYTFKYCVDRGYYWTNTMVRKSYCHEYEDLDGGRWHPETKLPRHLEY